MTGRNLQLVDILLLTAAAYKEIGKREKHQ
jgi:hypothetical protein